MYSLDITTDGDVLVAHVTGERTRDNVRSVSQDLVQACMKRGISKILVDVREMTGNLTLLEDYEVPARDFHALDHGGLLKAVALFDVPKNAERFEFLEHVARTEGFNFRTFTKKSAAMAWLAKQTSTT